MNEVQARKLLVQALGGTGPINNDRQFWTTVLTLIPLPLFIASYIPRSGSETNLAIFEPKLKTISFVLSVDPPSITACSTSE